jgi:cytochrome c oxidase cbb3-type subunit I
MTDSQSILLATLPATVPAVSLPPSSKPASAQLTPTVAPTANVESKPAIEHKHNNEAIERTLIDQSARGPVLTFFSTAIFWLLVSTVLGYIASKKLHVPEFVLGPEWLYKALGLNGLVHAIFDNNFTYGRVWPAYNTALIYGWCSLAGMGVATWLIGRLCRVSITSPSVLQFGAWFWNAGVALGVIMILGGYNTGLEYFELHRAARACIFIGYLLIGIWGLILFRYKRTAAPYISVSYLVAGFFLFPWFFGATDLLSSAVMPGVMKNVINAWYQGGLFNLWFGSLGLAAAYYFIPKVINQPIYSYNLAKIGFWGWIFLGGLTAMTKLSGGPIPAYLVTISIAASILTLIPIACLAVNFSRTMTGHTDKMAYSPTLRFVYVGTIFFAISAALGVLGALRSVNSYTQFTTWDYGVKHTLLIGFFSMVMFGAIYYITPRLVGCEWLSRTFIKFHFLGTAYGGVTIIGLFLFSGLAAGFTLHDSTVDGAREFTFANAIQNSGWGNSVKTYIGYTFFGLAQLIFAIHFVFMRLRIGQPAGEPTLMANPGEAH